VERPEGAPLLGHQLPEGATLNHPPLLHHHDLVRLRATPGKVSPEGTYEERPLVCVPTFSTVDSRCATTLPTYRSNYEPQVPCRPMHLSEPTRVTHMTVRPRMALSSASCTSRSLTHPRK
jgi:hypothetical protein